VPLLGGHLLLRPLEGLEAQERHSDIGAPTSNEGDTQLALVDRGRKLSVHAQELYRKSVGGLLSDVKRLAPAGAQVESQDLGGIQAALIVPSEPIDQGNDTLLLLSAYTQTADGLVQRVDFVANHAAVLNVAGCTPLAKTLAQSLAGGTRKVDLSAGQRKFSNHHLKVPADVVMSTERGPDFTVYHFYPVVPLGAPSGEALIYIGGFPEPFDPNGTAVSAPALGAKRVWRERVIEKQEGGTTVQSFTRRTVVTLAQGRSADLFVDSRDETLYHTLASMLETTR